MFVKLLMQLREGRDEVSVVRPNGTNRVVLGTRQPDDDTRRVSVVRQWGEGRAAPRQSAPGAIEEPLPQRTQTILSYSLPPALRDEINGGLTEALPASRSESMAGIPVKVKLRF
ncbi:MAG: hypothetical protein JWM03_1271 [Rhodocyclales bacterium]|nr:hypothetical protein [Rhodocyclales bacterium]